MIHFRIKSGSFFPLLKRHFGEDLLGILLFGSQVKGEATESSDIDLLIVLSPSHPLRRSLYHWWDEQFPSLLKKNVNPHFVHLPDSLQKAGGLWFEVALSSKILWERDREVSKILKEIQKGISNRQIERQFSHGQPYWVRNP